MNKYIFLVVGTCSTKILPLRDSAPVGENLRDCYSSFIERFGRKAYFIIPVDGERVEREVAEVVHILQLTADTLLHFYQS